MPLFVHLFVTCCKQTCVSSSASVVGFNRKTKPAANREIGGRGRQIGQRQLDRHTEVGEGQTEARLERDRQRKTETDRGQDRVETDRQDRDRQTEDKTDKQRPKQRQANRGQDRDRQARRGGGETDRGQYRQKGQRQTEARTERQIEEAETDRGQN